VSEWKGILAAPSSANRDQQFRALEDSCHVRGDDTSYPLLVSSLQAIGKDAAGVKFVTVSGDLIAHAFTCKFNTAFPRPRRTTTARLSKRQLISWWMECAARCRACRSTWRWANNDSDCGDYKLDAHSEFLSATGADVTKDFPSPERKGALESFSVGGYYNVALPIQNARLVVLNDLSCPTLPDLCPQGRRHGRRRTACVA